MPIKLKKLKTLTYGGVGASYKTTLKTKTREKKGHYRGCQINSRNKKHGKGGGGILGPLTKTTSNNKTREK